MNQHVRRWGNSAAVRLPASALAAAGFKPDDPVDIRAEAGRIVIEKASQARKEPDKLIDGITPDNRHDESDWVARPDAKSGAPMGSDHGEVIWIELDPQAGREQAGRRPASSSLRRATTTCRASCSACP